MRFIKNILGFNSPYSWTKWIRMSFAAIALVITLSFLPAIFGMASAGGLFGAILAIILGIIFFGPTLALMLGVSLLVGAIVGAIFSGRKQVRSFAESKATGDAEILALEKQRMKVQLVNVLFVVFVVVILLLAFIASGAIASTSFGNQVTVVIPLIIALILIVMFWVGKKPMNKRYKDSFREQVVVKGLGSVLQDMDFRAEDKLDESLIRSSGLFSGYTLYSGNDFLTARYKGIPVLRSDVCLTEQHEETYRDRDGDLRTRVKTTVIFNGSFMVFDYDAISNEPVFVVPRGRRTVHGDAIRMELDAFNQEFNVISKDAASAFRILTPPVLEGIVLARSKMGCSFAMSYKDDRIYVAIFNGDAFEASTGGDATLSEQRGRVTSEIQAMLGMVETLYLKRQSV